MPEEPTTSRAEEGHDGHRSELLDLETAFWEATKRRDRRTIEQLTDETCVVVGPQGIGEIDRPAIGAMIERAPWTLEAYGVDRGHARFRMIADGVAIVAYQVDERLVVDGQPTTITGFDSSVWVRRAGGWVCAMHTESLAGDPFARDRVTPAGTAHRPIPAVSDRADV